MHVELTATLLTDLGLRLSCEQFILQSYTFRFISNELDLSTLGDRRMLADFDAHFGFQFCAMSFMGLFPAFHEHFSSLHQEAE